MDDDLHKRWNDLKEKMQKIREEHVKLSERKESAEQRLAEVKEEIKELVGKADRKHLEQYLISNTKDLEALIERAEKEFEKFERELDEET